MAKDFDEFWGEPISVYTDMDALKDGILIDVKRFGADFNGKRINRVTCGAAAVLKLPECHPLTVRNNLIMIAARCRLDGEGEDAWGIFQPDPSFGNEKFWLVNNEVGGYTLMLPSDY